MTQPTTFAPEIVAKRYTYRNGRTQVVYTTPYPTEGPWCTTGADGHRVLMFMYAYFVFCWTEGAVFVWISHGTIGGPRTTLWTDVKIAGRWSGATLAAFGVDWTRAHLARFGG